MAYCCANGRGHGCRRHSGTCTAHGRPESSVVVLPATPARGAKSSAMSGNFVRLPASNPMSSLSGAHYDEADLPVPGGNNPAGADPSAGAGLTDPGGLELFRRAQSGDRGAFGQIVLLFQDRL